jgi:hypothetical protein
MAWAIAVHWKKQWEIFGHHPNSPIFSSTITTEIQMLPPPKSSSCPFRDPRRWWELLHRLWRGAQWRSSPACLLHLPQPLFCWINHARKVTRKIMKRSGRPETDWSGRNRGLSRRSWRRNRRVCGWLELSRLDSFGEDGEDDEADLLVSSARRGAALSGGAMARWRWWCEAFLLLLLTKRRKEKGWREVSGGGVDGREG